MGKFKDLTGMKFGRLQVINRAENSGHNIRWNCICDCGKLTKTTTYNLTSGRAKSCGCLSLEKIKACNTKHGYRHTRLYRIWCGMKKRCYCTKYEHYNRYGKKGIEVCDKWKNNFIDFKNWAIENGYKDTLEIDRIDNNRNYEPTNCRWRNRVEQVRNRTNTLKLKHNGEEKSLIEWCNKYNINYKTAYERYKKGWSFEKIFK